VIGAHPSLNADIRRRQSDSEANGEPGLESMQLYQGDIVAVHGGDSRGNMPFCMLLAARRELADRFFFLQDYAFLSCERNKPTILPDQTFLGYLDRAFCPAFRTSRGPASESFEAPF
jgi:hypothetical protein